MVSFVSFIMINNMPSTWRVTTGKKLIEDMSMLLAGAVPFSSLTFKQCFLANTLSRLINEARVQAQSQMGKQITHHSILIIATILSTL